MTEDRFTLAVSAIAWSLLIGFTVNLPAQQQTIAPYLVRDTVYQISGLRYLGRITRHKKDGMTRLTEPRGWTRQFTAADIDRIAWSDRSRIKFAKEIISLDSIPMVDVVYLKDGSVFRGKILSFQQGEPLLFQLKSVSVQIAEADISRIEKEPVDPVYAAILQKKQRVKAVYAFREHGFYSTAGFALLPGGGDYQSALGLSLEASLGYQFSRILGVGLGLGLDGYGDGDSQNTFLPLYVEARGYLWKKIRTPYWVVAGGYGFPLRSQVEDQEVRRFDGGYMFHPAIGYRLGGNKTVNLTIDVGYKFQKALTEKEFIFSGDILTRDLLYRRLSLRMGVVF